MYAEASYQIGKIYINTAAHPSKEPFKRTLCLSKEHCVRQKSPISAEASYQIGKIYVKKALHLSREPFKRALSLS